MAKTKRDVVLLHGDERFLVDERARALLDDWRKEIVSDFGQDTLEGQGLTPSRLQDAILQAPFLDPYRVVFARMAPVAVPKDWRRRLQRYRPTTRLLITVAGRIAANSKLVKAVTAAGGPIEEMQPLKGRALNDWAPKGRRATA